MKIPKLLRRKKLLAATARRSIGAPGEMDYEEMSEPNMKLSRALLIVLLLHVVAISGIIAFNAIKTRQSSFVPANPVNTQNDTLASTIGSKIDSDASNARAVLARKENVQRDEPKVDHSAPKLLAKTDDKIGHAKSTEQAKKPVASGKVYKVLKGDTPVTIAKKLKVSDDDLIALNHIQDSRKLQIGQKLLVPRKTTKGTKVDE
jgi:LysM repeat protein